MNLNTEHFTIKPCAVCAYPFSDIHHIWPVAKGGQSLPTVMVCPNHHRFANIVQVMVLQRVPDAEVIAFAEQHFDAAFNAEMLRYLIEEQQKLGVGVYALWEYCEAIERYMDAQEEQIAMLDQLIERKEQHIDALKQYSDRNNPDEPEPMLLIEDLPPMPNRPFRDPVIDWLLTRVTKAQSGPVIPKLQLASQ